MKLKIMTYNIASGSENGLNLEKIDILPYAKTVKEYMPDILGLNEVRGKNERNGFTQQNKDIADFINYEHTFFTPAIEIEGGGYGNALVSRFPIIDAKKILVPDAPEKNPLLPYEEKEDGTYYETRCILKATLLVENEKIDVFVTHFGLAPSEKESIMKVLRKELSEREYRCILMGDFNERPDSEYIKELSSILNNAEPTVITEDFYTYASYEPDRKIDYVMVEKSMKIEKFGAIDSLASDHRPYFAQVEI